MTAPASIGRFRAATVPAALLAIALNACADLPIGEEESFAEVRNRSDQRPPLPASIRILSWNVRGEAASIDRAHLGRIAEVIRDSGADVALLQEIHRGTRAAAGHDQFVELVELTGMNGCFGESLEIGESGSYGNAILCRAPLASARRARLPGRGEPRTLLRCESQWQDVEVPLLSTHLATWDRINRGPRRAQVTAIASRLAAEPDPLTILGGDFNAAVAAPEMLALRHDSPVRPVFGSRLATHRTGLSYDHLFVGEGWTVGVATVLHQGSSDHWPVSVELRPAARAEPTG
jgi:endonuclease/exonuclease/phosphatase family metal-dependent hydrolase